MWNLLKKRDDQCSKLQELLEDSAAARLEVTSVQELSEALSPAERTHIAACADCQETAQDLLRTREFFQGVGSATEMAKPWFATRVMAAIAARERELSEVASTWIVLPRFASRLAVASGALLLVASTWLYERPPSTPIQQASTLEAQESLFEAPPPVNQDDVLINIQENNP